MKPAGSTSRRPGRATLRSTSRSTTRLLNGGSVSVSDVIQYFVVAQDTRPTPNVGIFQGSFAAAPTSVALTTAAFPIGGTINSYTIIPSISGALTVCPSGCSYTSLTNAGGLFEALNGRVFTGT